MEKEIKFPHYCCFGKLQQGSVNETTDEMTAVYQMFGMKVHELSYNKQRDIWSLQEYSPGGEKTMYSCYTTLDKTICWHMNYLEDKENLLLKRLRSELLKLGYVWFAPLPSLKKGDECISYSPAGKLLAVRLLLSAGDDCNKHIKTLQGLFEYYDPETSLRLKMHEFYETSCIIKRYDDFNFWRMAFVAEFIVPLAFVYDTVKLFHDKGILIHNSIDRIFVQDAPGLKESMEYDFLLTDIPGATGFSVILKGLLISNDDFKIQVKAMEKKYQVESF